MILGGTGGIWRGLGQSMRQTDTQGRQRDRQEVKQGGTRRTAEQLEEESSDYSKTRFRGRLTELKRRGSKSDYVIFRITPMHLPKLMLMQHHTERDETLFHNQLIQFFSFAFLLPSLSPTNLFHLIIAHRIDRFLL